MNFAAVASVMRNLNLALALMVAAAAMVGCAGVDSTNSYFETRTLIVAEMNEVAARVTEQDLGKCVEPLEKSSFFGARYVVAGPFVPSLAHSCVVQGWSSGFVRTKRDKKYVAYAVALKKIEGAYGTGSPQSQGYCYFSTEKGVLEFGGAGTEMRVKNRDQCTQI